MSNFTVVPHRVVKSKEVPLLKQAGLYQAYVEIISDLKQNPYQRRHHWEQLSPKSQAIFSMRLNGEHRVVYTVDKAKRIVKIWSAWSHYERNMPK